MPIRVAVPKESLAGERRVALVPEAAARLIKQGFEVRVEQGAGLGAYYADRLYEEAGAVLVSDGGALWGEAEILCKVQPPTEQEAGRLAGGAVLVGFLQAHRHPAVVARLRDQGVTTFAMELVPRITRAQSMDALSSQATVAGYKGTLMAAELCQRFFPMLTTAAGTMRCSTLDVFAPLSVVVASGRPTSSPPGWTPLPASGLKTCRRLCARFSTRA